MSQLNVDTIRNRLGTGGPTVPSLNVTGVLSATTLNVNSFFGVQISGLSTFTSGPVLIGAATSTGTASQILQVTGGTYISGNLGIGTTNPSQRFQVGAAGTTVLVIDSNNNLGIGTANPIQRFQVGAAGTTVIVIDNIGELGIGTINPTSSLHVAGGDSRFGGVIETVSAATTYLSGSSLVLEMDVRQATTYTYTIPAGANIGIVSFRSMPAQTGSPCGSTVTLLITQNSAGTGNTTTATGIGTNVTVVGYENGSRVAGITTRALVSSGSTITLSSTGNDREFISFFIYYTGGTNTSVSSYQVYATKNGNFR